MKKLFIIPLSLAFFMSSCDKETIAVQPQSGATAITHSAARKLVDFNYYLYKDPTTGDYSCPTPKVDCSKISPDPTFSFSAIDGAIASGPSAVLSFFNTTGWENNFPFLSGNTQLVTDLQDGNTTVVRETNSNGDVFYFIVPYAKADNYNTEDIIYTSMLAAE